MGAPKFCSPAHTACDVKTKQLATKLCAGLYGLRDAVQRRAKVRWKVETLLYGARAHMARAPTRHKVCAHTAGTKPEIFRDVPFVCHKGAHTFAAHSWRGCWKLAPIAFQRTLTRLIWMFLAFCGVFWSFKKKKKIQKKKSKISRNSSKFAKFREILDFFLKFSFFFETSKTATKRKCTN